MAKAFWTFLTIWLAFVVAVKGSVPEDLSNFHNEYVCDTDVRLVRPKTVSNVEEAVRRHVHVKASGAGGSWNREFFCSPSPDEIEEDGTTANVVMTTIRPLSIYVDEEDMSAWVSAGVTVWDLMVYLGNYVTPSAPRGYALGSNPGYVNITIAGAVATNTHGSSLTYASLSHQAIGFRVVLANGTTTVIDQECHPFLFRAFQVSVGRLGVITDVKMRIIKETLVRRTLQFGVPRSEILSRIFDAQEMYKSTGSLPSWLEDRLLQYRPTTLTFAVFHIEDVESFDELHGDKADFDSIFESKAFRKEWLEEKINAPLNLSRSEDGQSISSGVEWEVPLPLDPILEYEDANNTAMFLAGIDEIFVASLNNATIERHESLVSPVAGVAIEQATLFDDYEVAVPVDKMADCLEGFLDLVEDLAPDDGLRLGALFRFVGKETGLLSVSHDKPQLWFSMPEYVYFNQETRTPSLPFRRLMAYLVTSPSCSPARLHWGKAGWPDQGCWNGAESYGKNWCDFGCAVRSLDPNDKFIGSAPDVWNWDGANLDQCCTDHGYDTTLEGCDCSVIPRRHPEECPEAPFYTNR